MDVGTSCKILPLEPVIFEGASSCSLLKLFQVQDSKDSILVYNNREWQIAMCHSSTREFCNANCPDVGLILGEEMMNSLASLVAQASEGNSLFATRIVGCIQVV